MQTAIIIVGIIVICAIFMVRNERFSKVCLVDGPPINLDEMLSKARCGDLIAIKYKYNYFQLDKFTGDTLTHIMIVSGTLPKVEAIDVSVDIHYPHIIHMGDAITRPVVNIVNLRDYLVKYMLNWPSARIFWKPYIGVVPDTIFASRIKICVQIYAQSMYRAQNIALFLISHIEILSQFAFPWLRNRIPIGEPVHCSEFVLRCLQLAGIANTITSPVAIRPDNIFYAGRTKKHGAHIKKYKQLEMISNSYGGIREINVI